MCGTGRYRWCARGEASGIEQGVIQRVVWDLVKEFVGRSDVGVLE